MLKNGNTTMNGDLEISRGSNTSGHVRALTITGARNASGNDFARVDFNNYDSDNSATNYTGARISSQNDGSTDDGDLRFYTKSGPLAQKMVIQGDGDIGIGLTPNNRLDVRDDGSVGNRTIVLGLASNTSNRPSIQFSEGSQVTTTSGMSIEYDGSGTGDSNRLNFNSAASTVNVTIENGGNVGIGVSDPSHLLELSTDDAVKPNGGSWDAPSDRRLKQNIREFEEGLESIMTIRPVRFQYNELSGYDTQKDHVGVIAQELEKIAPHMVKTGTGEDEYKTVNNSAMTYMLINAVKEQQDIIEQQNARLDEQEREIGALKGMLTEVLEKLDGLDELETLDESTGE